MRRQPTDEQKARAEAKREKFREIAKTLKAMPDADRDAIAADLGIVSNCEGHVFSPHNMLMLHFQRPGVTLVGGFRQWKKLGRSVKKGESGMLIWCKTGGGKAETEDREGQEPTMKRIRFLTGTVFDVSQTEEMQDIQEKVS